ncbi:MAG TPA: hypothetical protein VMF53_00805 [Alphaproteobacteria bacterium]|nr:hypothetical protein [Alphaproteobacteria bacterium]
MASRIVFVYGGVFAERDWARLGLDEARRRGLEVEIVELHGPVGLTVDGAAAPLFPSTVRPQTVAAAESHLARLTDHDAVLADVALNHESAWLYRLFARKGVRYAVFTQGALPTFHRRPWKTTRGMDEYLHARAQDALLWAHLAKRFACRRFDRDLGYAALAAPAIWLKAGDAPGALTAHFPHPARARVVDVESFDMGLARAEMARPEPAPDGAYAVFLDEMFVSHPDFALIGAAPPPIAPERYFELLRNAFDRIERETGLNVVVAAHPKARYGSAELFGGREIAQGRTAALVRGARLVLAHCSTSLGFAVAFRKPVLLLAGAAMEATPYGVTIARFASWLGAPRLDMAEPALPRDWATLDDAAYDAYARAFLARPGASREPTALTAARALLGDAVYSDGAKPRD